jgi:RNA polymerase sigma-70 factor (ECF subfamily)
MPAQTTLLAAAQGGDEAAFAQLVEPFRGELHAHCYRMLGSVHDAEDALQDALLRAWRAIEKFEGRSSLRSWLYTIATNASLTQIGRRPKQRMLPIDLVPASDPHDGVGMPLTESTLIEPYPDEAFGLDDGLAAPDARYELRESVELAFVAALQHLPPNQRAALILREVLGFSAAETADALETSVASINSALQRARRTIDDALPDRSQQATLRALADAELEAIVQRYMDAMAGGDIDAVIGMLAQDAVWSMPPLGVWYTGVNLRGFLEIGPLSGEWSWKHAATRSNGQLAIGAYTYKEEDDCWRPFALDVLTLTPDGAKIAAVTSFIVRAPEGDFPRFPDEPVPEDKVAAVFGAAGLPERLD